MQLISLQEATQKLGGVSLSLLRKAVRDGRLPATRIGRRVFLDQADLEERLRSGQLFTCMANRGRTENREQERTAERLLKDEEKIANEKSHK